MDVKLHFYQVLMIDKTMHSCLIPVTDSHD